MYRTLLVLFFLILSGCASLNKSDSVVTTTVVSSKKTEANLEPRYIGDSLTEFDLVLINKLEPVPKKGYAAIEKWLNYFQGRGKKHMQRYLQRSTRYIPLMKQILRQEGLPEDLVYISLIESGFNPKAYSYAAAVGYWQFIRPTGRQYKLKISTFVDERRDPVASTRAAANYFKALYNMFDSWYLSMASYNSGESRVKRSLRRYRATTFWDIARKRRLPAETRNYVPKFIAAKLIATNPSRFGFKNLEYHEQLSFDSVQVSKPISIKKLAKKMGIPVDEIKRLNPALRSNYLPVYLGTKTAVRVPKGYGISAAGFLDEAISKPPKYIAGAGLIYRIRRGDSLYKIARKYGTTITRLRHENGLRRRSILRIGKKIRIPERRIRTKRRGRRYVAQNHKGKKYRVRKGDSLYVIARRFGTTISKLRFLNGMRRRSVLKIGRLIQLPAKSYKVTRNKSTSSSVTPWGHYRVRSGDSLYTIARKFKTTIAKLRRLNNLGRRSMIKPGLLLVVSEKTSPVGPKMISQRGSKGDNLYSVIRVRRGQNLSYLAQRYKTSISDLKKINNLKTSGLRVGQTLRVPKRKFHVVQPGETLIHIAKRYEVSLPRLKRANLIKNSSRIMAGRQIYIPK